ncbi:hypothetical protein Krac_2514 [Ktedonobacter racemifer DSM 44963]|uniref:Uncharacterized protein n=1 Tax=Ktedonobacter racemifer DSM 44963 TaxID=485913 RepID=D6TYX7_KTERA|nr:hypothetical protein Krac_2514 [Ktedonobacter racemifer DSM 44963]
MLVRSRRAGVGASAHRHQWIKVVGSVGLFHCSSCLCSAVCPGCLGGMPAGHAPVTWCSRHRKQFR